MPCRDWRTRLLPMERMPCRVGHRQPSHLAIEIGIEKHGTWEVINARVEKGAVEGYGRECAVGAREALQPFGSVVAAVRRRVVTDERGAHALRGGSASRWRERLLSRQVSLQLSATQFEVSSGGGVSDLRLVLNQQPLASCYHMQCSARED
jgi:hypothetical protein